MIIKKPKDRKYLWGCGEEDPSPPPHSLLGQSRSGAASREVSAVGLVCDLAGLDHPPECAHISSVAVSGVSRPLPSPMYGLL